MSRRRAVAAALLAVGLLTTACRSPSVEAFVAPDMGSVVDVAVAPPAALDDAPATPFRQGLREALYQGLLDRRYSPLDPDYVDAVTPSEIAGTTWLDSEVTDIRRSADGGVLISGWAELRTAPADGDQTLYRLDAEWFEVPPPASGEPDDGRAAGRLFGAALLSRLPPR